MIDAIRTARVYDLAQPYFTGMAHFPTHPPFLYSLTRTHGDYTNPGGGTSAADAIALGTHVGTHIDALCHFACGGMLYDGVPANSVQSYDKGFARHGVETIAPILRRGVLFDVAGHLGLEALPSDFSITPGILDAMKVDLHSGDIALLRTGWGAFFRDHRRFVGGGAGPVPAGPGPELAAARWLSDRGVFAAGSDTIAFERVPAAAMPVHIHLLVESGIHIIECLNLEELARAGVREFAFVAAPLKIDGATGAPLRPLALVENPGGMRS